MSTCNAHHPSQDDRCVRPGGHSGDHASRDLTWPRARGRGTNVARSARGAEVASAVLSDLAAGRTTAQIAAAHGLSTTRVRQIATAGGVTLRGKADATREMHDLARRVRELAAAAGEDPADWLEDAARCREACEEIAKDVTEEREAGEQASWHLLDRVLSLAIGPNNRALAAQVRGVVDAADECAGPSALAELAIKLVDVLDS